MTRTDTELDQLWERFHTLVNMSSRQLRDWLASSPQGPDAADPADTELGWELVKVLGKRKVDVTGADREAMSRAVETIGARLADRPDGGAADGPWRHGLMALGHDPLMTT